MAAEQTTKAADSANFKEIGAAQMVGKESKVMGDLRILNLGMNRIRIEGTLTGEFKLDTYSLIISCGSHNSKQ